MKIVQHFISRIKYPYQRKQKWLKQSGYFDWMAEDKQKPQHTRITNRIYKYLIFARAFSFLFFCCIWSDGIRYCTSVMYICIYIRFNLKNGSCLIKISIPTFTCTPSKSWASSNLDHFVRFVQSIGKMLCRNAIGLDLIRFPWFRFRLNQSDTVRNI